MLNDAVALATLRQEWAGVLALRDRIQRAVLGSFAQGGTFVIFAADAVHNLPMLHAFGVLNNTLIALRDEGHFGCKTHFLGALMDSSRSAVSWVNFDRVKAGVVRRNDVAHRGAVLPRGDCWELVDAIRIELESWGIVGNP